MVMEYERSAKVCGIVYNKIAKIVVDGASVRDVCKFGTEAIITECEELSKTNSFRPHKSKSMYVGFPVSISLNNCVGNYVYEEGRTEYNTIRSGDVVKIEFGVNIDGYIALLGETIVVGDPENKMTAFLRSLEKKVLQMMIPGNVNDDVRTVVESLCTENECFPVENTLSYQAQERFLKTQESKYIVLNFTKYYDKNEYLAVEPNTCFEFENGEVYHINLTIAHNENSNQRYKQVHDSHIYAFNDCFSSLKLKSAKEFNSSVKRSHGTNGFVITDLNHTDTKSKMGMKECKGKGILDEYIVYYNTLGVPIYHKKFTAVVKPECGYKF